MKAIPLSFRKPLKFTLLIAGLVVFAALLWQGITASGNPDPTVAHISHGAAVLDTAILVFREGLETILVLAAITASFVGANQSYQRPVATGAGFGFLASVATWFVAVGILSTINAPALDVQAATGLLAIVVLLVVMNWFFHKIYWTGWISLHNRRRRQAMTQTGANAFLGLAMLGFTSVYREGFEVVLFLQSIRLQVGSLTVLEGVVLGLAFTSVVGAITFVAHHKMPYKKMLVLTGVMLGAVLIVMVGESVQEMQQAGWLPTTPVHLPIPDWLGLWFAVFPNVEALAAQIIAAVIVLGSYFGAQYLRVWRPRQRGATPARRAEAAPTDSAPSLPAVPLFQKGH